MRDESVGSAKSNRGQANARPLSRLQLNQLHLGNEASRVIAEERGDHTKDGIAEAADVQGVRTVRGLLAESQQ